MSTQRTPPQNRLAQPPAGMAIVTAMLLVLMVSALAIGLASVGAAAIARAQVARDAGQARYVAEAARDYARWILLADRQGQAGGNAALDHLSEPWAQPIPRTRLDRLFGGQLSPEDRTRFAAAYLSGQIVDEQGKFNLQNLIKTGTGTGPGSGAGGVGGLGNDPSPDPEARVRLGRLVDQLGLPAGLADALTQAVLTAGVGSPDARVAFRRWGQLSDQLSQGRSEVRDLMRAQITWLPERTTVNLNTATAPVLTAMVPGMDPAAAQQVLQYRARIPMRSASELQSLLKSGVTVPEGEFSAQSRFFRVTLLAQFGEAELVFSALLQRDPNRVLVIDHREDD